MNKDDLKEYKDKRDLDKTDEPDNSDSNSDKIFVIQRHDASNLHYDFRFAYNGVLKSWAVPKGVPKKSGVKHLAIRTEDHPLDYADFEGEIPEDQYGGGTVEIYDRGT
ncbi:MAG: DNA polymerase ligase N-terminal domain-containing protein, partial [candidate division WOR-3 bacterium]|nr:DNA polymerase ligase N-terminal domain-containing protein [candidate division WOR-3 bacterium]